MAMDLNFIAGRFERFARDVLVPAAYTDPWQLEATVFQCAQPIPLTEAVAAAYKPVQTGWEWGPVWTTAWFQVRGQVPSKLAGKSVALRFSAGTEALIWRNGEPWHGLDLNRDSVVLFDRAIEGNEIDLRIEAACNHNLGQLGTHWDPAEFRARWRSATPGRLERCEIAAYDETAWRLATAYVFATQLMKELPGDSARGQALAGALRRATNLVADNGVSRTARAALAVVEHVLGQRAGGSAPQCHAVGHAHIDTAWLWPIRETKRKCLRTFATALANLDRFPSFRFLCSQAQQYAWVEQESPALFERIRERVADGRWEPGGAMWIEPDCNLVSGESLVRQITHGTRYWRSRFGVRGEQRYVYLPDTFGFTPALPQIMQLAGLRTFITHKLSWNQTNRWPHTHFVWRGLGGAEVVAHQMPGHDYNLRMTPRELRRGERNHDNMDLPGGSRYLQPFGFGDGGGGPTEEQVLNAMLAADCEGLPRVAFSTVDDFCAALHADRDEARQNGEDFPMWDGELYLEAHRGTFTTQAAIKLANRRAEEGLRIAEVLTWGTIAPLPGAESAAARVALDAAWKLTLLNQFHDIIPGSSIGWVYQDAAKDHEQVRATIDSHVRRGLKQRAAQLDAAGLGKPVMIFNATNSEARGVVEVDGEPVYVDAIPPVGVRVIDAATPAVAPAGPARFISALSITNGIVDADFDSRGMMVGLRRTGVDRELCARERGRALGELMLYEDHPRNWDAWDIDPEYDQKGEKVKFDDGGVHIVEMGPMRVRLGARAKIGVRSTVSLEYVLNTGSPRIDVHATVEWRESHRLLRVLFPTALRSPRATYECAFGCIERSTGINTSHERAAYEVPGHRWVDLSDAGGDAGLAVLNDCKYGHSCREGVIGISLLRAPKFPDETADMGRHRITYSIMPHAGDWPAAGVDHQAELLNAPLMTCDGPFAADGAGGRRSWAPVTLHMESTSGARATIAAMKIADDDDRLVLRLVETRGRRGVVHVHWNVGVADVFAVDLHEQPQRNLSVHHDREASRTTVALEPFAIVTLAARR